MNIKAVVEIIPNIGKRYLYSEDLKDFHLEDFPHRNMGERAFEGFYGWIDGFGDPPGNHLDVFVYTDQACTYGDYIECKIIGVFHRGDGDHKLIAIDRGRLENDLYDLSEDDQKEVFKLYDGNFPGDAWLGLEGAKDIINKYDRNEKRRF